MSLNASSTASADNDRSKLYKNNAKPEDSRRRRNESSIELRRQRRDNDMMKRRNITEVELEPESDNSFNSDKEITSPPPAVLGVQEVLKILRNNPPLEQLQYAFEGIRKMLSKSKDPPIKQVIQAGLVDALVKGLIYDDEKIKYESAWALTNIVSGNSEETMIVIKAGASKPLIDLVNSDSPKLAEQAIWAVANIVGDSLELRDKMISEGLIEALNRLLANVANLSTSFIRIMAWTYSNLVRHKNPQVHFSILEQITPGIITLLQHPDPTARQDSCWALSYLTDGPDQNIQLAYENGVIPYMLQFVNSEKDVLTAPALRVLGNFATGSDELTQIVVDSGLLTNILPRIFQQSTNHSIIKECCWLISNVAAGTPQQIQAVIDAGLLANLVDILKKGEGRCKYEASWAIANIVHGGNSQQLLALYHTQGCIDAICYSLTSHNNEVIVHMLEALFAILEAISNTEPLSLPKISEEVEECGGLDNLEKLQVNSPEQIYTIAIKIIEKYFMDEEDEFVENQAPEMLDLSNVNTKFDF